MKLTIFELVLATVLSVTIGLAFAGWTLMYDITKPILVPFGLKYALSGFWLMGGLLPAVIIRKPGVAVFSELIAAAVEAFISKWGIMSCAWGLVQGLGAELVFLLFLYRRWNFFVLSLAALLSAAFSFILQYFYAQYWTLQTAFVIRQFVVFEVSSIFFAAFPTWYLVKKLVKTGLLNNFKVVHDGRDKS